MDEQGETEETTDNVGEKDETINGQSRAEKHRTKGKVDERGNDSQQMTLI